MDDNATEEEEQRTIEAIDKYNKKGQWLYPIYQEEEQGSDYYFSHNSCDLCGDPLYGNRYPVAVMGDCVEREVNYGN